MSNPSNMLGIPLKRSCQVDVRGAVVQYLRDKHPETHPDAFKWDIDYWAGYRTKSIAETIHADRISVILTYVSRPL